MESSSLVLVTGGNGLIGRNVCQRLASKYRVISLDVSGPQSPHPSHFKVTSLNLDVSSARAVRKCIDEIAARHGSQVASVIHLAAYYSFSGEPSPLYDRITVRGTRNLLTELKRLEVEQFVFSSTMLVHAPTSPGRPIREDSPIDPRWDYPRSKVRAEKLIREHRGSIPSVSLRIAGVYDDRCHSIPLANHIRRIYERQFSSHFFPGDPSHGQSFIHLDDLVEAIAKTVEKRSELPPELSLLIGEADVLSFQELQDAIGKRVHGSAWTTFRIPKAVARWGAKLQPKGFIKPWMIDYSDDHYELDISKAKDLLSWVPQHGLAETLPIMAEALRRDPLAWYRENKFEPPGQLELTLKTLDRRIYAVGAALAIPAAAAVIKRRQGRKKREESGRAA